MNSESPPGEKDVSKRIIKNGTVINADRTLQVDLLIDGEKIAAIGPDLIDSEAEILDVSGMLVMPGGIDPHVHLDLPMFDTVSSDDHYTGHKAAAFGGTTTAMDFVPQDLPDLLGNVRLWRSKADPKAAIDFGFHMNITHLDEKIKSSIPQLLEEGITTLKVFMAYNGRLRLQDGEIFEVLRIARKHGMLTMLHAENGDVIDILVSEALAENHLSPEWHADTRPPEGAVEAALRGAALAAQAGAPLYIVHMNTGGEVDMLDYARKNGMPVMGETCPQYLFFTRDDLKRPDGAKWICSPPMRTEFDQDRLWEGLKTGIIQTIGTDHCPFFYDGETPIQYEGNWIKIPGKELGKHNFTKIPNGLPGIQDRLPILWTNAVHNGRITANQFVALTSTNAAKIFGLYPQKGVLLPGSDADLQIWDPMKEVVYGQNCSRQRTDYNLYEGWHLVGYPVKVFLRGQLIVDGDNWLGSPGMGRFVRRKPWSQTL
jgi:dihydropyrimidinase